MERAREEPECIIRTKAESFGQAVAADLIQQMRNFNQEWAASIADSEDSWREQDLIFSTNELTMSFANPLSWSRRLLNWRRFIVIWDIMAVNNEMERINRKQLTVRATICPCLAG